MIERSRAVLSNEEVERYHRHGFIVTKYKLSTSDVGRLQELTMQLIEENPRLRDKFMTGPHVKNWETRGIKGAPEGAGTPWHGEAAFGPITPLATASVWIAVFDSVIENGCDSRRSPQYGQPSARALRAKVYARHEYRCGRNDFRR